MEAAFEQKHVKRLLFLLAVALSIPFFTPISDPSQPVMISVIGILVPLWLYLRREPGSELAIPAYALQVGVCISQSSWLRDLPILILCGALTILLVQRKGAIRGRISALVLMCLALGYLSGKRGSGGGWELWLVENLQWTQAQAEFAVHFFRKTVHFVFYGTLALLVYGWLHRQPHQKQNPIVIAILFVICIAAYDETRQFGTPGRSGSALDVALDLAGASTFLALAERRRKLRHGKV